MQARKFLYLCALLLGLPATGCSTIQLRVLEPGAVFVPTHIQTVAVLDRSRAGSGGERVLGAIEGALTGEDIGADAQGRADAMRALVTTLGESPRFKIVQPTADIQRRETSLFDDEISFLAAERICRQVQCEGIIALEAFDSDSRVNETVDTVVEKDDKGREHRRRVFKADRDTRVVASWRFYDVRQKSVVDELRDYVGSRTWSGQGDSPGEARSHLPAQAATVGELGGDSGHAYARRIAPTWVYVSRPFYGKGNDQMKAAKQRVKIGDWPGAANIWQDVVKSPDPKLAGKAHFNLALAAEVEGDLDKALGHAREAALLLDNGRSRDYVLTIEQRIAANARLQKQLAPPPPPRRDGGQPPPPPPPRQ